MAEHLFIRMSDRPDTATVVVLNEDAHILSGPETLPLSAAAGWTEGRRVTVLLPGRDIVGCTATVPATSPARLRQMLPYSLEDEFAGDIAELHFVPGERNEADDLEVSVIARERLAFWLRVLESAGIEPARICSEADGVSDTPGVVTLFLEGRRILGRRPGGAPFCFEELDLAELWELLDAEREDAGDLDNVVLFVDSETKAARQAEIDTWRAGLGDVNIRELAEGITPRLAAGLVFRSGSDLLQGDYARRSGFRVLARPWRAAAGLALAFIAFSVIGKAAELYKLSRDESRLTAQASSICAESYGLNQLSRCLAEMGRRLADSGETGTGGGSSFLTTLMAVAEAIDDTMTIDNLAYREQTLTIDLNTQNLRFLEAFDERLTRDDRFVMTTQNTTSERDGSTTVRVRVTAAGL